MTGKKKNIRRYFRDFQRIDGIIFDFQEQYIAQLYSNVLNAYPDFDYNDMAEYEFKHMANEVFNTTESVIDKDLNYPIYRMRKELHIMKRLSNEKDQSNENPILFADISNFSKKLAVDYFPGVFNLSGNGFRLLESNIIYLVYVFLEWVHTTNRK